MPTVDPGFPQEGPELREHGDHRSNLPSMADWNWNLWVPCTACLLQCQCTVFDRCVNFTHSLRKPSFDKFCHNLAQDAVKAELQRTNGDVTKGRDLAVARLVETYQCQWFFLVETHRELMIHFFNLFLIFLRTWIVPRVWNTLHWFLCCSGCHDQVLWECPWWCWWRRRPRWSWDDGNWRGRAWWRWPKWKKAPFCSDAYSWS